MTGSKTPLDMSLRIYKHKMKISLPCLEEQKYRCSRERVLDVTIFLFFKTFLI